MFYVRLCSLGKIFGCVRLSSITEPNQSQSNDWSSIGFEIPKVLLATQDLINALLFSGVSLGQSTGLRVPIAKTAKNMTDSDLPTRANTKRIFVTFEFGNKSHFFICLLFPFLVKSILLDLLSAQGGPFNSSISDQR